VSDKGEAAFREAERRLDALLTAAREALERDGVTIEDQSARSYHYKNQYLTWAVRLELTWQVSPERARVTVYIEHSELAHGRGAPELRVSRRAEVFQVGKTSRIDVRAERRVPLAVAEREGLGAVVRREIDAGTQEIEERLTRARC
jgi:hypothetical protein